MAISEFTAEQWIAIGTISLAFVTALLVLVGTVHISAIRHENKKGSNASSMQQLGSKPKYL